MNFVLIMTDSQSKFMVGAYGNPKVDTPNLDRLAADGVRFDRGYTASPLCTPARGSIFSGLCPQINGSWLNEVAPAQNIAMMGHIFRHYGFRAAYTGKWHLDGTGYFGDGVAGGGFEPDWWYDGKQYAAEIGPEMFSKYRNAEDAEELREAGFVEESMWGHRVADRGIDFLEKVGDDNFVLVVSFDEPHGPCVAPPEYWESFDVDNVPMRPNFGASTETKPRLQQIQSQESPVDPESWDSYKKDLSKQYGCNAYIDREIGRVIDAVERLHGDDTVVIYTSDHGGMQGSHSLSSKGPMMYEEICNIPFIVKHPAGARGAVSSSLVSHLDIIPTMLDLAGIERPEALNGISLAPILNAPEVQVRDTVMINFHRFSIGHETFGEFYPIRCIVDDRSKLAVNLFETDEFYDLVEDPYEIRNLIDDPCHANDRDRLHDALLAEMDRIRDPFRSYRWGDRAWRSIRAPFYSGRGSRSRPDGFPFQSQSLNL